MANPLTLIGIMVAIALALHAASIRIMLCLLKHDEDTRRKEMAAISLNTRRHEYTIHVVSELLVRLETLQTVHSGLPHRVVCATQQDKVIPGLVPELGDCHRRITQTMHELMLLNPVRTRCVSSIRQLSQVFGDHHSLNLMRRVRELQDSPELQKGIKLLEDRLGFERVSDS